MNEALTVQIKNPFALREALLVALEVSWPDLPAEQASNVKALIGTVPCQNRAMEIHLHPIRQAALLACAGYFRNTKTCQWLREDLRAALVELMTPLQKGA